MNWKAAEIERLITASSKPEIRAKFGPPDRTFDGGAWSYTKMKILDPDTEKNLSGLKIWFHPGSDNVRRIVISD